MLSRNLYACDWKRPRGRPRKRRPVRLGSPPLPAVKASSSDTLSFLFLLRPHLPGIPAILKLRLGLFQGCYATPARHLLNRSAHSTLRHSASDLQIGGGRSRVRCG
jgi:hypothetical protein